MLPWIYLIVAGILETAWAYGLKVSEGFTRFWPSLFTVVAMAASLYLLALALRTLPLGTAYTIWTGIGAIGTVILGIALLGESADLRRLACIALILAGLIGLKLVSPH